MNIGDLAYAQQMRDIIKEFVVAEFRRLSNPDSTGTVTAITPATSKCMVQFEATGDPVSVHMFTLQPFAVGAVVRVSGPPGLRYVSEVIAGQSALMLRAANGNRYRITVSNTGTVTSTQIV